MHRDRKIRDYHGMEEGENEEWRLKGLGVSFKGDESSLHIINVLNAIKF